MEKQQINFHPALKRSYLIELSIYCKSVRRLIRDKNIKSREETLLRLKDELINEYNGNHLLDRMELVFFKSLLLDMLLQGWNIKFKKKQILLELISYTSGDKEFNFDEEKARTRKKHLLQRNSQLKTRSVSEFILNMEKVKLTSKGWHSIFSVMKDGNDMNKRLSKIANESDRKKNTYLQTAIQPYLQFVEKGIRCEETGLLLSDIWRYFRHTWVKEYKSLPGRTISILVRDAASLNHPVIGIAALGSAVAQQTCRDEWIGWDGRTFFNRIKNDPSAKYGKWIIKVLNMLFNEVYLKDFYKEKVITKSEIKEPCISLVQKLKKLSHEYKQEHINNPHLSKFTTGNSTLTWEERAKSNLFKSKRAVYLADLLMIKIILNKCGFKNGTKEELKLCVLKNDFREAVEKLIRKMKSIHLGIDIMEVIVCGSIAPYNLLTGGKLVSMLITSPEVTAYYNKKYSKSISLIASSMKGNAVCRKPNLVFLSTTSLYHVGSSQYNRIKIPVEEVGGIKGETVEFKRIGMSDGYGSFHFSSFTIELADIIAGRNNGNKRVNSIFGEGSNPLIRKIKDSIEHFDLDSKLILNHRSPRVVYAINIAQNFRDVLAGIAKRTKYLIPQTNPRHKTELIAQYWIKRWMSKRITNKEVMDEMKKHSLTHPITHGGRIPIIK